MLNPLSLFIFNFFWYKSCKGLYIFCCFYMNICIYLYVYIAAVYIVHKFPFLVWKEIQCNGGDV